MVVRKAYNPSTGGALQTSFLMPCSEWKPPSVSDLPSWKGAKRIAIDCETKDTQIRELGPGPRRDGYTVGWSFAIENGPKFYLPIRHEGGDNMPVEEVLRYLREQAASYDREYVGANINYDMDYAYYDGIRFNSKAKFRDIQIADPLIYELHRSFSLANIGKRWGVEAKDETLLREAAEALHLHPKTGLWRLPARYVGAYGEQDASSPLEIYAKQREALDKENLWDIFNLETDVTPILVKMRRRGVRIDQDKLSQIEEWALKEETELLKLIHRETGVHIKVGDVWKAGVLAPALGEIGVRLGKTSTGAPQIDKELLESIDHPVANAINKSRKINKIRTTFAKSIRTYMVNGRIHCTFNQIAREDEKGDQKGARYGRLSAVDPNLQQQPNPERDREVAGEWRKIFVPEEGSIWGCSDFSQQEPRWTTQYAALLQLPKAEEAARRYRNNPDADNHDMMTRLIHTDRQVEDWLKNNPREYKTNRAYSKDIFLGLCYGEGGAKLCHTLGFPTRWSLTTGWGRTRKTEFFETRVEAWNERARLGDGYVREAAGVQGQAVIDKFDAEVPYVRRLAKKATERANEVGYVTTALGRKLHFDQREDGTYDWTHKALNRIIQGTSADQMKLALVALDKEGVFLQLQVHDEADGSYGSVSEAQKAGKIMRDCILDRMTPLVPFKVDVECGPSWGEIK